ncbi:GD17267 [Drosophila simulans]|uniref:GD17267 n=1 Tax=Drosophila simulans TaxID=7240 RepID=B4R5R5_DROSI|nr:GD17267 [Drosophila simulans]
MLKVPKTRNDKIEEFRELGDALDGRSKIGGSVEYGVGQLVGMEDAEMYECQDVQDNQDEDFVEWECRQRWEGRSVSSRMNK